MSPRRPRLALPFTFLTAPGVVRLVAGEDFRYTLTAPHLEQWLPALLSRCDGRVSLEELLREVPAEQASAARHLLERLGSERLLVEGTALEAHRAEPHGLELRGRPTRLCELLREFEGGANPARVIVLIQDRLDLDEAFRFNRERLRESAPWLWVSAGAMTRGYVSPVFLPDAGPCLACLLRTFRTLSPAPEIHDALLERGGAIEPVPFPDEAAGVLAQLARWKVRLLSEPDPPPALYRLHVVEVDSLEVSSHRVFVDPECPDCARRA